MISTSLKVVYVSFDVLDHFTFYSNNNAEKHNDRGRGAAAAGSHARRPQKHARDAVQTVPRRCRRSLCSTSHGVDDPTASGARRGIAHTRLVRPGSGKCTRQKPRTGKVTPPMPPAQSDARENLLDVTASAVRPRQGAKHGTTTSYEVGHPLRLSSSSRVYKYIHNIDGKLYILGYFR